MFRVRKNFGPSFSGAFALVITLLALGNGLRPAYAQFECDSADVGEDGQGANADGSSNNTACGNNALASGTGSGNTAAGAAANASGDGSLNTANGFAATASGDQSRNTAVGAAADATGDNSINTALGFGAEASGDRSFNTTLGASAQAFGNDSNNMAVGVEASAFGNGSSNSASGPGANSSGDISGNVANGGFANASGDGSTNIANGFNANASGNDSDNIAIGSGASAAGDGRASIAIGAGARAEGADSTAIGAGAVATRDDQMAFGTANNTYTMGGVASDASSAAQQGPLEVVTTDAFGNLASDGGALQRQIDALGQRDRELAEGIAIALALDTPNLQSGQSFALRVGYGNFDGSSGLGVAAAGLLDKGFFGDSSTITLDGGVGFGTTNGTVAGKAGLTFGW